MNLENKKVTVIGLGKSGLAAAKLLKKMGAKVRVTDINKDFDLDKKAQKLHNLGINVELGKHSFNIVKDCDLLIVSPGVSDDSKPLIWAKENNIPVMGEIELGYRYSQIPIIAVTGTNGKTTVSTIINNILDKAGINSVLCGNIGIPLTEVIEKDNKFSFIILEISSFQLERVSAFKPFIGVLLEVDADHLDRHKDIYSYKSLKYRLFSKQTKKDWQIIVNPDYKFVNKQSRTVFIKDKKVFSEDEFFNNNISLKYEKVFSDASIDLNRKVVLVVLSLIIDDVFKYFDDVKDFSNLEHRLKLVAKINNVSFINDSKSTNISSGKWALDKYDNILLIAGGRNKKLDFNNIPEGLKNKVKHLFVMGESSDDIKKVFLSVCPVHHVNDLKQAVEESYKMANAGDTVLFSPMCSSFDMFRNYEERGEIFKQAVMHLKLN